MWVMFLVAILLAIKYTFFDLNIPQAWYFISSSFLFYFLVRNPKLLHAKSYKEFWNLFEDTKLRQYAWGTTPLLPAFLLISSAYIAIVKYGVL